MSKLSDYIKSVGDRYIFTGERCEINVSQRFQVHDLLFIESKVRTLGVFDINIYDQDDVLKDTFGYFLPAVVTMCPSDMYKKKIQSKDYYVFVFNKNDVFIESKSVLRQSFVATNLFKEFMIMGNVPRFMKYTNLASMYDTIQSVCGVNLKTPHAVFELLYAYISRDPKNLNRQYRYTDLTELPYFIGLKNVVYATKSVTSKIAGSYLSDGLNAAIVNPAEQRSTIEDMLRS